MRGIPVHPRGVSGIWLMKGMYFRSLGRNHCLHGKPGRLVVFLPGLKSLYNAYHDSCSYDEENGAYEDFRASVE